ncbi:MAG TPA: 2-oxoglutarate dehydrogenase E1 component [Xanthomonadales bacterium]|nr:2-oxoglutarate dehydrogenase E1 component [Xanthomonadales bacterium]
MSGRTGHGEDQEKALSQSLKQLYESSHLYGSNAPYIESYYETWLSDPEAVPQQWAKVFRDMHNGSGEAESESGRLAVEARFEALGKLSTLATDTKVADHKQAGVLKLINAYRVRGHENSNLDPLGRPHHSPVPDLDLQTHDLTEADLDLEFDTGSLAAPKRMKLRDIIDLCRNVYCGNIGVEYMHIVDTDKRRWLQERLEGSKGEYSPTDEAKKEILRQLLAAEGIERYLHTRYVGQKRFSLEGGDSLIPLLNQAIRHAGNQGIHEVVVGMAHRGRLNVLVNVLGKSPSVLFDEFEGKQKSHDPGYTGDVKYHLGYSSDIRLENGQVHVALAFNPSHLEIVDPVVVGSARARQDRRIDLGNDAVMPILVHGDAAFAGQGVVMELFQMSEVPGFAVGGTLHVVVNNQLGFTVMPRDARSTMYCTTIAKMVHAPIFHVNADDPEAVMHVMEIACDFRKKFKRDVVIDLICYRRHGHNEADEPAATQPVMYQIIRDLKSTAQLYADRLVSENVLGQSDVSQIIDDYRDRLDQGKQVAPDVIETGKVQREYSQDWSRFRDTIWSAKTDTTLPAELLESLATRVTTLPDGYKLHPRVEKIYEDRRKMTAGELPLDWGYAETLAYASLINEGHGLRLVGQDSGRGTFFHRHAVCHNQETAEEYIPLTHLNPDVNVAIIDSLLSEEAVLGFEYGYACSEPEKLVIWEAQFGDFVNGAQVVIDQFITSGEAKWGRLCGLVMFLPHGYEGQGPEHSSARLERFLQLCSFNNIQVCIPTTPAQMFHMLRRQLKRDYRKPLVVMTPKSLLRSKASTSTLDSLTTGSFKTVIDDVSVKESSSAKRVVLCSGKVFYDLDKVRQEESIENVALVRIEQLYPFPADDVNAVLRNYPDANELTWCQEEPQNQGAWYCSKHHFEECLQDNQTLFYAGRASSASPAAGSFSMHIEEQKRLVEEALTTGAGQKQ